MFVFLLNIYLLILVSFFFLFFLDFVCETNLYRSLTDFDAPPS